MCVAGRAYFELVDYKSAADAFETARRYDPSRLDGMEVSKKDRRDEGK